MSVDLMDSFYWFSVRNLTKKHELRDWNMNATGYWVTAYNEPGKWWAMGGHERLATCDTRDEARFVCVTTFNLMGAIHVPR